MTEYHLHDLMLCAVPLEGESSAGVVYQARTVKRELAELLVTEADGIEIELIDVCAPSERFKNRRLVTTNVFVRAKDPKQHQLLATILAASSFRGERLRVHLSKKPIVNDVKSMCIARRQLAMNHQDQISDGRDRTRFQQERDERDEQRRQIEEEKDKIDYQWEMLQQREDDLDNKERQVTQRVEQLKEKLEDLNRKSCRVQMHQIVIINIIG
jgi:hypothetical protein